MQFIQNCYTDFYQRIRFFDLSSPLRVRIKTRFTVAAHYCLFPRLELGVKIPYVSHKGGFLDGFIESYHRAFGFPNGGRDQARKIVFSIVTGVTVSKKSASDSSGSGIGDVIMTAAFPLSEEKNQGITLNAALKLPTGTAISSGESAERTSPYGYTKESEEYLPAAGTGPLTDRPEYFS